jgi:hypothetical protein
MSAPKVLQYRTPYGIIRLVQTPGETEKMHTTLQHLTQRAATRGWKVEAAVRTVAGALVLASLGLGIRDKRWLLLTAFVGANLFQSGLSGWCLLSNLLSIRREPRAE